MWEAWNINHHHGRDQHWTTIKRSKWAQAKACVYADSVLCVGRMEKAKLKISGCIHNIKMLWESMEKQLSSSRTFHQDFRHCLFFKKSRKTLRRRTSNQRTSLTGSSSCQCSTTFCRKQMMRIASRTLRKSRVTRRNSYHDVGRVQSWKRDGMATHDQQGQWDRTANKMVQQFRDIGHLIFTSTSDHGGIWSSENVGIFSELGIWKQDARRRELVAAWKSNKIRPDDDDGWRNLLFHAETTRDLELIRKLELWQLFTQVQ